MLTKLPMLLLVHNLGAGLWLGKKSTPVNSKKLIVLFLYFVAIHAIVLIVINFFPTLLALPED